VASALIRRDEPHRALIGLAYLSDANAQKHRDDILEKEPVVVTLPDFITGGPAKPASFKRNDFQMAVLRTLYILEDNLAKRSITLDMPWTTRARCNGPCPSTRWRMPRRTS
jgi:hypothetical protein